MDGFRQVVQNHTSPNSLSHNSVMTITEDPKGNFWLGTDGGGLNYWDVKSEQFTHYRYDEGNPNSPASDAILDTYLDGQYLWFSMWNGGLNRMNLSNNHIVRYPFRRKSIAGYSRSDHLNIGHVWKIHDDHQGNLFLGTHGAGLAIFDQQTNQFSHYNFDPKKPKGMPSEIVWEIFQSDDGSPWIGSLSGTCLFILDSGECDRPAGTEHLFSGTSDQSITNIFQDAKGIFWLGSDSGLYRYDSQTHELVRFGKEHGLENETVRTVIKDNAGKLWLGHKRGISSFDENKKTFTNYTHFQGQMIGEINARSAQLTRTGKILFGGAKGLYIVEPEKLNRNNDKSKIVITELKVLAKPVRIGDGTNLIKAAIDKTKSIELSHEQRMLTLNFSALNFRHATASHYAYYLEGFDNDWIQIGQQRSATYTNLNPGTYTFKVKASSNSIDWSAAPATMEIIILPPLWKTPWAYALYAATTVTLGYIIFMLGRYKRRSEKFEVLSITDPLTGLFNRAGIHSIVNKIHHDTVSGKALGMMLIDIDHFKAVNDNYGHDVGDDVITALSDTFKTTVRSSDYIGRWGGEEFILICPNSTENSINKLANRVRKTIAQHPIQTKGHSLAITVSIGYGTTEANEHFEHALKRIDVALYHAKNNGRNIAQTAE